jgi:hypothetical protein
MYCTLWTIRDSVGLLQGGFAIGFSLVLVGKGNRRHGSSTIIAGHRLVTPIKFVPYANDHHTIFHYA